MSKKNSFFIESDLNIIDSPSQELIEKASIDAKSLVLPNKDNRQPDLLYGKSIFVSTGSNINGAYFLPAELVKARESIIHKALDIDHNESLVVGHLVDYAFQKQDDDGTPFDAVAELEAMGEEEFNKTNFDIASLFVMHRMRFPEVAEEILSGNYKVSMETFYKDFDILVGDVVVPKEQAEKAGLIKLIGRQVRIVHNSRSILGAGTHKIMRRFIGMHFSGCGLVKKPANPRSMVLEAASERNFNSGKDIPIIEVANISSFDEYVYDNDKIEINTKENSSTNVEAGLCLYYEKNVYDINPEEAGAKVIAQEHCSVFEEGCPVAGDFTNPTCLVHVFKRQFDSEIKLRVGELMRREEDILADLELTKNTGPYAPGMHYSIDEVNSQISTNTKAGTIQELTTLTKSVFASVDENLRKADEIIMKMSEKANDSFFDEFYEECDYYDEAKPWKSATKTSLPDSSFAVIEPPAKPGGSPGRFLPHHNNKGGGTSNINLDMSHLRNAMARANQIKSKTGKMSDETLRSKAMSHLSHHKSALKGSKKNKK